MKEEQQRTAIAEACGWKYSGLGPKGTLYHPNNRICFDGAGCSIPNYHNSLNAIHEAEGILNKDQQDAFRNNLAMITTQHRYPRDLSEPTGYSKLNEWCYIHATAAQRAEAFLRTIGKWKD